MVRFFFTPTQLITKWFQIVVGLALYFLLCALYREVVVPVYSFGGFELSDEARHAPIVPVLLLILLVMPTSTRSMSDLFLLLSFYFLLMPAAALCALQGSDIVVFLWMSSAIIAVTTLSRLFGRLSLFGDRFTTSASGKRAGFWVPFSIMAMILAMLALHVSFTFRLSFSAVYDHRFDFNEGLEFPLNYLLPFAAGPLAAFLSALSISRREWPKAVLVVLCGLLFYGFSTHKAFLFIPVFSIVVYFAISSRIGLFFIFALVFGSASLAALAAGPGWADDLFGAVFANRLVFIPAQIHFVFFDEFSKIGFLCWAESKISLGLVTSPLPMPSVNYIAEIMTGDSRIGANVGWLANGYMNLGLVGIFIYAVILSFLLSMIDRWSRRLDRRLLMAAFSVPIFSIVTSNDLLVAMLTGGLLPMLLLLWFLMNQPKLCTRYKNAELRNVRS